MSEFNKAEFGYAKFDDATRLACYDVPVEVGEIRYGDLVLLRKIVGEAELSEERPLLLDSYNRIINALDRAERQQINGEFV